MNRKDVYDFFGLKHEITELKIEEEELELLTLKEIESNFMNFFDLILGNYKSTFTAPFKKHIIDSFSEMLNEYPSDYFVVNAVRLLNDSKNHENYLNLVDLFLLFSRNKNIIEKLFVPMIYHMSYLLSNKIILSDLRSYYENFEFLTRSELAKKVFENEWFWGFEELKINTSLDIYTAYEYDKPSTACFLDGFLMPYLYLKSEYNHRVDALMYKTEGEILNIQNRSILNLHENLDIFYRSIFSIITFSRKNRENFIQYMSSTIKKNEEIKKMVYPIEKYVSDGFMFNLNYIFSSFCENIVKNNMINKIKAEYCESDSLTESFTSFCFFSKIKLSRLSTLKIYEILNELAIERSRFEAFDDSDKKYLAEINSKIMALETQLKFILKNEKSFFCFVTKYLKRNEDFEFNEELYTTFVEIHWLSFTIKDDNEYKELLDLLGKIFTKGPVHKSKILEILTSRPEAINFMLLNLLVDHYNSLEKNEIKYGDRQKILRIVCEARAFEVFRKCNKITKFINYVLRDFEYMLNNGLSSIVEIKKYKAKYEEAKKIFDEACSQLKNVKFDHKAFEELKKLRKKVFDSRVGFNRAGDLAKGSFDYVRESFELINHIISSNINMLLVDELISNFVNILNCNLKVIVGPECSLLRIKNPEKYNFDPKFLLRRILLIYTSIKDKKFIDCIANEKMYFNINLFKRALEIVETKFIMNADQCYEIRELINNIEKATIYEEKCDDDDEFIDPLTFNPINDPVKLLTSNVTIDRTTFNIIMLNDGIDPFNRMEITEDLVVDDVEMRKKIEERRKG